MVRVLAMRELERDCEVAPLGGPEVFVAKMAEGKGGAAFNPDDAAAAAAADTADAATAADTADAAAAADTADTADAADADAAADAPVLVARRERVRASGVGDPVAPSALSSGGDAEDTTACLVFLGAMMEMCASCTSKMCY